MKARSLLWVMLMAAPVFADECGDLAQRFADRRDEIRIGELDTLKACVNDLLHQKVQSYSARPTDTPPPKPKINTRLEPMKSCVEDCPPPIDPNNMPATASGGHAN